MSSSTATALVLGATGNVGHGAALAFLEQGLRVVAPTRSASGAAQLRATFEGQDLHPVVGDVSDPDDVARVRDHVRDQHGPLDHAFVSLGPWWQGGAVAGQPPAEWARVRTMLLDGHVHVAAQWLPVLAERPGSSYTIVTGMGAVDPLPGTSLLFVATNGVLALSRVLRQEHREGPVRVNELRIGCRVEKVARGGVVTSAQLGQAALAIAQAEVRSEVLGFDGPDTFALPRGSGR